MIDFTKYPKTNKSFNGANGSKISIIYQNERYMVKFPGGAKLNSNMSYSNSSISEYLGSHILQTLGFETQQTILGTYEINNQKKLVVACKDFAINGNTIQDFASIKNQIIDSVRQGAGTELESILETIEKQNIMPSNSLRNFFWDMFIADAFIGNWDRHNGNWGFLYNEQNDSIKLAPLWDAGSSLYPQADEEIMKKVLTDKNELLVRIYERPESAITINGKKIRYFDFIKSNEYPDCTKALKRILPKINLAVINKIIDETKCLNEIQKTFYKTILKERKERILDQALEIITKKENEG